MKIIIQRKIYFIEFATVGIAHVLGSMTDFDFFGADGPVGALLALHFTAGAV